MQEKERFNTHTLTITATRTGYKRTLAFKKDKTYRSDPVSAGHGSHLKKRDASMSAVLLNYSGSGFVWIHTVLGLEYF